MTKPQIGTALIVVGAVVTAISLFSGSAAGLFAVGLVVLGIGLFLKFKK
jgi:hypothetical protein